MLPLSSFSPYLTIDHKLYCIRRTDIIKPGYPGLEAVPLKELGGAELERLVVDGGKPGVDFRDEGKHTGRNDLLFVEKMMWMDERV